MPPNCTGVGKDDNEQFQAHAWVESGERVLIGGRQLEEFAPLVHPWRGKDQDSSTT